MTRHAGFLHLLRCEGDALSTLAVLAVLSRVLIAAAGLAMAPSSAFAGGPGLVICSGTSGGVQPVKGSPWRAAHCPCAACHHAGCAIACTPPPANQALPMPGPSHATSVRRPTTAGAVRQTRGDHSRIRAPPLNA